MNINETIIRYIQEELLNNEMEEELEISDDLLGGGILDSLSMMKLILYIETHYKTKIPPQDMVIENFMTVSHISNYLTKQN